MFTFWSIFVQECRPSPLKETSDAQTHDLPIIEFLDDFHILYISYENINFKNLRSLKVNKIQFKREK